MKKLLILAYDFPPYVSVGGLRPYNWYKHLLEFNVYPVVITRQWNNKYGNHLDYIAPSETKNTIYEKANEGEIIRTPYFPNLANRLMIKYGESKFKFVRKIISAFYEFFQWTFYIGPKSQIYFEAKKYLKNNKVDAIIATGDPFILFRYANDLSKKQNIPWIADYRDPWSQDYSIHKNTLLKFVSIFFEKKIVKNAIIITTVCDLFKNQISNLLKKNLELIHVLTNGYDDDSLSEALKISQDSANLSIGFIGTINKWDPIKFFLTVISDLKKNNSIEINVNFYGINIENELKQYLYSDHKHIMHLIEFFPKQKNNILLQELAKNNLFLLFNYYSYPGTKIYDYIGLKRNIILCYSNDPDAILLKSKYYLINETVSQNGSIQENIINYTKSGVVAKNAEHLKELLEVFYMELKKYGFISCNSINTEQFSRKIQTQKLAELIKDIVKV